MPTYTKVKLPTPISITSLTTVFEVDMAPRVSEGGEAHDFCEILYVQRGKHTVLLDGFPLSLGQGQMVLYAPGAHHRTVGRSSALAGIISFEASEALAPLYNRVISLSAHGQTELLRILADGTQLFCDADPATGLLGMLPREGVDELELQQFKLRLELFLLDLYKTDRLTQKVPYPTNRERYRKDQYDMVRAYLDEHLDRALSLGEIARDCSMSVSKIKLLFREHGHRSPMAYFNDLKIKEAQRLIRETSLN
ncbi:MAG: AraC family ligand binding domain-containing protein, partial [Clostridia bacterium]|nr:AraC family ligand binding domain-containing protein [Clostridia bacterium]